MAVKTLHPAMAGGAAQRFHQNTTTLRMLSPDAFQKSRQVLVQMIETRTTIIKNCQ